MKTLSTVVVAALFLGSAPAARAQVYPERVAVKSKAHVVEAYQRRMREESREEQTERTTKTLRLGSTGSLQLGNIAGDTPPMARTAG